MTENVAKGDALASDAVEDEVALGVKADDV